MLSSLRPYQQRIVEAILKKNTIVLLPTGAGKTLIAAEVAKLIFSGAGRDAGVGVEMGVNTLFLVPTCLLVEQQAAVIRSWTGLRVAEYMRGAKLQPFDVLVSTPEAFKVAQTNQINKLDQSLQWGSFGLVVFDEVHHVLKHHPYRHLATSLRRSNASPRVVGLSASLTYEVKAKDIESQMRQLWGELNIDHIATAEVTELQDSGYHATQVPMEVRLPVLELPANLVPQKDRLPHKMHTIFFERIGKGSSTAFASALMTTIRALEIACAGAVPTFKSPLDKAALKEWGAYAHSHAEQYRSPLCAELEHWYEALRLLIVSWEEAQDAATTFLRMTVFDHPTTASTAQWPPPAAEARAHFTSIAQPSFARFDHLKDCLRYKLENGDSFRGIVFVNQRVTTHILEHVISSDPTLSTILRPACIYAAGSPATPSLSVSKRDLANRVAAFSRGDLNLLISTVVAEEGMDVAAANCVIRFDSMVHAVSMVQGRGRARQADSSFIVLSERTDRPATALVEVEQLQKRLASTLQPDATRRDDSALRTAQKNRERIAREVLLKTPSLASLMEYCQKTKVDLRATFSAAPPKEGGGWRCTLFYESDLRLVTGQCIAPSRKVAKGLAAVDLLQTLARDAGTSTV